MKFFGVIDKMIRSRESFVERDNAVYLEMCGSAYEKAKHIVFDPMSDQMIMHLIHSYKRQIPEELIMLYKRMNGATLFRIPVKIGKYTIPMSQLLIFGVPLTNSRERIEPYNISIEDLRRPNGTPDNLLKFGSYYVPGDLENRYELFVNTDNGCVCSVENDKSEFSILKKWESIDDCLCELFEMHDQNGDGHR